VPAAERHVSKVGHAAVNLGASAGEVAIIEDTDACTTEGLNRGDVIAEVTGKSGKPVAASNAEVISGERGSGVEASPATRIRPRIPSSIPSAIAAIAPGIGRLRDGRECKADERKYG